MAAQKYVLFPGLIVSNADADQHWVDAVTLMKCYRLAAQDCVVATPGRDNSRLLTGRIALGPRFRGDYAEHLTARTRAFLSRGSIALR